jgi:hypothetical protein
MRGVRNIGVKKSIPKPGMRPRHPEKQAHNAKERDIGGKDSADASDIESTPPADTPLLSSLLLLQSKENARDEVAAQDEKQIHSRPEYGDMQGVVEENHEDGDAP